VQRRNRHAANPDRLRVYDSDRYRSDPRLKMLAKAKQRAAEKNLEFNLTLNDITIPALCPLLGVSLTIGTGVMADSSPSLDRIRNEVGYVRGNVIVVSYLANRAKGTLSADELMKLAVNLKELENTMPEWLALDKGFI
jgi:hypothetical protein